MNDGQPPTRRAGRSLQWDGQPASLLRHVSIGGVLGDLDADWRELEPSQLVIANRWINGGALALAAIVLLLAGLTFADVRAGNVVHVFARTEHVRYTPLKDDPPQWLLENVTVTSAALDPDALFPESGEVATTHTAERTAASVPARVFFQPRCGDDIVVSRIGKAQLLIDVRTAYRPLFTDEADREVRFGEDELGGTFTIAVPMTPGDAREGSRTGSSTVWPLEGRIDPGRAVSAQTNSGHGLLLEGKVEVIAGRAMDLNYSADHHELEIGDQVILPSAKRLDRIIEQITDERRDDPVTTGDPAPSELCRRFDDVDEVSATDKGFIHLDDRRGMNLSFSSNSRYAEIARYRTTPIRVENNWVKRLVNNPFLPLGWAALGVFFLLYRRAVRWRVSSLARESGQTGGPPT